MPDDQLDLVAVSDLKQLRNDRHASTAHAQVFELVVSKTFDLLGAGQFEVVDSDTLVAIVEDDADLGPRDEHARTVTIL